MFIKNMLREELENSERLRAGYERELAKLSEREPGLKANQWSQVLLYNRPRSEESAV